MNTSLAETMTNAAALHLTANVEEALAELCRARDSGHRSPKLYSALGHLQFEMRQFDAAAKTYEELGRQDDGDTTAPYNLAVCLEKLGSWEQAAAAFRKAVEMDPRRTGAHLGLGICYVNLQRPQEALEAFERCLERQPFREAALRGKAFALRLLNRHEEALALYQRLLVRDPHSEELLSNAVALAIAQGNYDVLEQCAQRLREVRPDSRLALECLALAASARRDYVGALQFCTELVEAVPDSFAGWFNRGVVLQKRGQYQEAAGSYSRAAEIDPQSCEAHLCLGAVLQELEQWEPAQTAYEKAIALQPDQRTAVWNQALLLERTQRNAEAEKLYTRLVELDPDAQDAWFRIGHIRLHAADYAGAIAALQKCAGIQQKHPEVLLNIGIAHWKMNDPERAREAFRRVLSLDSKSVDALRCLASMAVAHQDLRQALALYTQLLEISGPGPELLYNMGLLLQKLGRSKDAVGYYRQALAQKPDFSQAWLNLGHAQMILGEHDQARSSWKTALLGNAELAEQFLA